MPATDYLGTLSNLIGILIALGTVLWSGIKWSNKFGAMEMKYKMEIDALKEKYANMTSSMNIDNSDLSKEIRNLRDEISKITNLDYTIRAIDQRVTKIETNYDKIMDKLENINSKIGK